MNVSSQIKWVGGVVGLIGLWLIVGPPFLFEAPFPDFWNDLLVGVALVALAGYAFARSQRASSQWALGTAALLGCWMVLAAFLWGTSSILQWNDVVTGGIVAVAAGYSAYEARETFESSSDSSGESSDENNGPDDSSDTESDGDSDDESGGNSDDSSDGQSDGGSSDDSSGDSDDK